MWELGHKEGWGPKNWCFELWCWRKLLRVPWTARRSNQSVLKEINPECSLEGLRLKLQLQCFGQLMWRVDSLEKTLMLGKTEGKRTRGWHSIMDSVDMNLTKLWETVKDREAWRAAVYRVTKGQTWLSYWATPPPESIHLNLLSQIGIKSTLQLLSLLGPGPIINSLSASPRTTLWVTIDCALFLLTYS